MNKKIIKILIFFVLFIQVVNVNAKGKKLEEVGVEITDDNLKPIELNVSNVTFNNISVGSQKIPMTDGDIYEAVYKNAFEYDGESVNIKIRITPSIPEGLNATIYANESNKLIYTTARSKYNDIVGSTRIHYEVTFYKSNEANRLNKRIIFGISDPDAANYYFDTTGKEVWYKSAARTSSESEETETLTFSQYYLFETEGNNKGLIINSDEVIGNEQLGKIIGFNSAIIAISIDNGYFEFDGVADSSYNGSEYLTLPYIYNALYNVTYVLNGGQNNPSNPLVYTSGTEATIKDPTREGYRFLGWEEGNKINATDTGDKTFTAKWEKIYNIDYVLDDGENNPTNPSEYTSGTEIIIKEPTREGYEFLGWEEGNIINATDTGDKTFTAKWKKNSYNITTKVINGTIDLPTVVEYDNNITINYKPTTGYVLKSIKVDGKPVDIKNNKSSYTFEKVKENHEIIVEYEFENPQTGTLQTVIKLGLSIGIIGVIILAKSLHLI